MRGRTNAQHGGSRDPVGSEVGERLVGGSECIGRSGHVDMMLCHEVEEFPPVGSGVRRDAAYLPLPEQVPLVVQFGDVAEMDAGNRKRATRVERLEGDGDQVADRCKQDGSVQRLGGESYALPAEAAPSESASSRAPQARVRT